MLRSKGMVRRSGEGVNPCYWTASGGRTWTASGSRASTASWGGAWTASWEGAWTARGSRASIASGSRAWTARWGRAWTVSWDRARTASEGRAWTAKKSEGKAWTLIFISTPFLVPEFARYPPYRGLTYIRTDTRSGETLRSKGMVRKSREGVKPS